MARRVFVIHLILKAAISKMQSEFSRLRGASSCPKKEIGHSVADVVRRSQQIFPKPRRPKEEIEALVKTMEKLYYCSRVMKENTASSCPSAFSTCFGDSPIKVQVK